jgi:hypothetical protein
VSIECHAFTWFLDCVRHGSRCAASERQTRLMVTWLRLSVAIDASDAVGANTLISNAGTRGMRRSDGRYCASSVGSATDATVQRLSPPFLLFGEANG